MSASVSVSVKCLKIGSLVRFVSPATKMPSPDHNATTQGTSSSSFDRLYRTGCHRYGTVNWKKYYFHQTAGSSTLDLSTESPDDDDDGGDLRTVVLQIESETFLSERAANPEWMGYGGSIVPYSMSSLKIADMQIPWASRDGRGYRDIS